jgi:uncharacterized protein YlxW (UPF0749 family)
MPDSQQTDRFVPTTPPGGWHRLRKALTARPDRGQVIVAVLLAALGLGVVMQVRYDPEDHLEQARRTELIQILSDLNQRGQRLESEIAELETTRRELASGADTDQAALEQTAARSRQLAVLAGTAPATGPGVVVTIRDPEQRVRASHVLSAVQEMRVAGAEAMQIAGGNGATVRLGASSYFLESAEGLNVDGFILQRPYVITAIGSPQALAESVRFAGGTREIVEEAEVEERAQVVVDTLREPPTPQYARPAPDNN